MRLFLHKIMVDITRHPREVVTLGLDFEWSNTLWIHNLFRLYEMLFGRRAGIKAEMSSWNEKGRTYYKCHSWESVFALAEANIRGAFKWKLPVRVYIPVLSTNGVLNTPYLFAIAFDNAANATTGSGNRTATLVVSGSNRLAVFNSMSLNDTSTAPTYNAVSGTLVGKSTFPGTGNVGCAMYYLLAPATGSNTASFNFTAGVNNDGVIASYTGVAQTGQPDSHGSTNGSGTTITGTTTVVASGCWLITACSSGAGPPFANGTGTLRNNVDNEGTIFDSNGTVSTGSQSITITQTTSGWEAVAASFSAAVAAAIKSGFFFMVPH